MPDGEEGEFHVTFVGEEMKNRDLKYVVSFFNSHSVWETEYEKIARDFESLEADDPSREMISLINAFREELLPDFNSHYRSMQTATNMAPMATPVLIEN